MARCRILCCVAALFAAPLAAAWPPSPALPRVGLMAATDEGVTASMAAGARLALTGWRSRGGVDLELTVAEPSAAWSAASGPAVEMAFEGEVVALITPPDRQTAHLLAQLGTRAHLPIVSTSAVPSVTATGSFWVVAVASTEAGIAPREAFRKAYRKVQGDEPDEWAVLGYDAASTVAAAVQRAGLDRRRVVEAWRAGLTVSGASGEFGFDESGRRQKPGGSD